MFSQDDINAELRTLARAEARERLDVEARLLRTGHVDQEDVPLAQPLPERRPRWWHVMVHGILTSARRARRVFLGSAL